MDSSPGLDMLERTPVRVLYGDTDSGGVVYYANYLRYFEAGRTEFMRQRFMSYRELEAQGLILPVVESHARYKASAFYDDLLVVETILTELRNISCRFEHRIVREDDNKLLAKGYTIHAVINRAGKLTKFPAELLDCLGKFVTRK